MTINGETWRLAVVLTAAVVLGSCESRQDPDSRASSGAVAREGHVYLAQLAALHPLYADLERIEQSIAELRGAEKPLELPQFALGGRLGGEYIAGPVVASWPEAAWQQRRQGLAGATCEPAEPGPAPQQLPPDLQATVQGRTRQAQREYEAHLLRERAEAEYSVAEASTLAYRDNLEALEQERAASSGADVRGAVQAQIDARTAEVWQAQQARLSGVELQARQRREGRVAAARREAQRQAASRLQPPSEDVGRLREQLAAALTGFEVPGWIERAATRLPTAELPAAGDARAAAEESRSRAREKQLQSLIECRARVTRELFRATRLAAEKVARQEGIRLHYVPEEQPVGADLTAQIAAKMRKLWAGAGQASGQTP